MAEIPPGVEPPQPPPPPEGAFFETLRQPRIVLLLLAGWAILGALTEFFTSSGLFVDLRGGELDGALGGRALGWEQIPLAVLYLYCARNPARYPRIFLLALIEQVAALAANVYHLGAGDFSAESIIIPVAGAGTLAVLSFVNVFQSRPPEDEYAMA
jgi:hypothetical protein